MSEELKVIISAEISKLKSAVGKAKAEVDEFASKGKAGFEKFQQAADKTGQVVKTSMKVVATALAAAGAALIGLSGATQEYREDSARLTASFEQAGLSAESATSTIQTLYGVIGEHDQAVEAAQQIALLANSEEEAAKWAGMAAGVVGTFGDALQPETFFEAANETMKLGEATGAYVQMLEGAGLSVDEFNSALAACTTEEEKQALMLEWTEKAVGTAADAYNKATDQIQKNRIASLALTDALSQLDAAIEPVMTDLKMGLANVLYDLVPAFQDVATALQDTINGAEGASGRLREAVANLTSQIGTKITELLPKVLTLGVDIVVALVTGISSALPQILGALNTVAPTVISTIGNALPQITGAILAALPALLSTISTIILAILEALGTALPEIATQVATVAPEIVTALTAAIPLLVQGAVTFLLAIVDAIPVITPILIAAIPDIVVAIVTALIASNQILAEGALQLFMAFPQTIPTIINLLISDIGNLINKVKAKITGSAADIKAAAGELFGKITEKAEEIINTVLGVFEGFKENLLGIFSKTKDDTDSKWQGIKDSITKNAEGAKTNGANKFNELKTKAAEAFTNTLSDAKSKFDNIRSSITDKANSAATAVSSKFSNIKSNISSNLSSAFGTVSSIFGNIATTVGSKIDAAKSAVTTGINAMKAAFNFSWSLPKLKLPHIKISGKFSLNPPSVPSFSIAWYKRGGVFDFPTLFGYGGMMGGLGEDGAEAIVPLEHNTEWLDKIAERLFSKQGNTPIILQVDGTTFARTSVNSINQLTKQTGSLPLVLV